MRYLKPLRLKPSYYQGIEKTINAIFFELCFAPIIRAFRQNGFNIYNSNDPVSVALRKGKIFFFDGKFTGEFDAKIVKAFKKLGAIYNAHTKSWSFKVIPANIQVAIADVNIRMEKVKADIISNLDQAQLTPPQFRDKLIAEYRKVVHQINQDFLESVKSISMVPELTLQMQENIAVAWGNNLELYIKKWTNQNIIKLREEVATNTYNGQRAEGLIKNIQADYGVSKRKAKFLARQETSLLVSKLREERYKDAGVLLYKWSGVMDERERPDHKLLEDTIQSWDSPPIVDRSNARRAHPGEDFGCRCIAIPVVK